MTKRAVLYARVSKDDTSNDNRNIDSQLQMGRDYATEKGYQVINELPESDKGASGASIDLPQLNRIRDLAAKGAFDILVVREIDRLSRNLAKQLIIEQELKSHGVEIEYVLAEYEDSPEGRLSKHIRATIAEYEREKIKERMTRGKRNKVKAGSVMISHVRPFGYQIAKDDKGNGTLIIDEFEADMVRQIFTWYVSGDYTINAIAKKLTELKVPTVFDTLPNRKKTKPFGTWGPSSVRNILGYETYTTGQWGYSKTSFVNGRKRKNDPDSIITVAVPTIIDSVTFDLAQAQLKENIKRNRRNRKNQYLMSGRVFCGHCRTSMRSKSRTINGKQYRYYTDPPSSGGTSHSYTCDNRASFPIDIIDNEVWAYILAKFNDPKTLKKDLLGQLDRQDEDISPLRDELITVENLIVKHTEQLIELNQTMNLLRGKRAERSKAALINQIEQEELTLDKLESEKDKIQAKITEQIILTEDSITDLVETAKALKEEVNDITDFEEKRNVIRMLDVKITLWSEYPEAEPGKRPKPEMTCQIACVLGTHSLSVKTSKTSSVDRNRQKNNGIVLTYTFNLKSPQYSIAA